jgi:hypothetical protein|tara:strand:+ start:3575 stop:4291 length:717 start_codon:yes stop_codon:yes gene_type:complete
MSLPKLNDVPKYELTIPSTGKVVSFRPFLVKEQKVLLIAMESQEQSQILRATLDTISACCGENINVNSLTTFDVDYIFTQIRARSVGETSKISLSCVHCEGKTPVVINLSEINVDFNNASESMVVKLTDQFSVKMMYPKYSAIINNPSLTAAKSTIDVMLQTIIMCLDSLMTEDEIISFKDEPLEEVLSFIENLNPAQFELLNTFISNLPKIKHKVEFNCEHCKEQNSFVMEGIESFF